MKHVSGLGRREVVVTVLVPWVTFVLTGLLFVLALNVNYLYNLLFGKP
jgi:hypothetical protein